MLNDLETTKSEYLSILGNRGKSVSPSISCDKLLKKVKYLKKRDLKHLSNIRNITVSGNDSVENILDALFKDIHKKNQVNVVDDIYR